MRLQDVGIAFVRIFPALLLFLFHGQGKLISAYNYFVSGKEWGFVKGVAGLGFPAPAVFALLSTLAETVGSFCMILGLFTRYAAAIIFINMSVAVYRHLTSDMRYELAAVYGFIALAFIFLSPGRFSLDAALRHKG